jgi:hypothetical protein
VAGSVDEVELVSVAVLALYIMRTVWALIVMPRSRSRSMASSTCATFRESVSLSAKKPVGKVDLP